MRRPDLMRPIRGAVRRVAGATVLRDRLAVLADTLAADRPTAAGELPAANLPGGSREQDAYRRVADLVAPADRSHIWLTLAVLAGRLPDSAEVLAGARAAELDGVENWLRSVVSGNAIGGWAEHRPVTVVSGRVVVDVHHTAQTDFATGIQRVTREATRRWVADHDPLLVGWVPDQTAIRALTPPEAARACEGGPPVAVPLDDPIVVPWRCSYLLPELAAEVTRTGYLQALAQFSGSTFGLIGYDLVPITTAETSHEGMAPGFTRNLAAARYARVIVPISHGAAGEYLGWRDMLVGTGLTGPRIDPVVLPAHAPPADPGQTARAAGRLTLGSAPLVLVVGSHEPRKNHVAVLHAAERLWRAGLIFTLTFIGGNSWNSEAFTEALRRLQDAGRPVETISAATDELLFGGYRTARFTVFPSVNEGFGLPVAESLACGTPVITSNFGAMKEIADAGGGALLVDPRDDDSITDAMRALLTDDELLARLTAEAKARPTGSWDDYARATWAVLTGG